MFRYFYGEDTFGARQEIDEIANREGARIEFLDREDLEALSLSERAAQGVSSLFGKNLLVVRDPSEMPKGIQGDVVKTTGSPAGLGIVWDRREKRNIKLAKAAGRRARHFPALDSAVLVSWLEGEAVRLGVKFGSGAAQAMIQRLGRDRWRLGCEVARLSLRHDVITPSTIRREVPEAAVQHQIFAVLDALVGGRGGQAIQMVQDMLAAGENEFFIFSMLAHQFRSLYLVASGNTQGLHPYVVEKNRRVAVSRPAAAWSEDLTRITAADFAVKQGKAEAPVALTMLMLALGARKAQISKTATTAY